MKASDRSASLATLVTLRERAVDRLSAEIAAQQRERERFRRNLDRMEGLCAAASSQGLAPLALAMNLAHYKQGVLQMADAHRTDLALHDAQMAVTRRALDVAAQKQEVMGQVLDQHRQRERRAGERIDQKRQDEIAAQLWNRTTR